MAGARGIRAGRAFVEPFADDSGLVRGLRRASARVKGFGEGPRAAVTTAAPQAGVTADPVADMRAKAAAEVERIAAVRKVCGADHPDKALKVNGLIGR